MASGFGRRIGKDKLLLPYKNKLLAEHIIEKVRECDFNSRILVARDEKIISLAEKNGLKTVKNKNAQAGQSEAIKLGIINSPKADGYMFFTADQPLLDIETIKLLIDAFEKNNECIIVPRFDERRGSPVIFPLKYIGELLKLEGDTGGRQIINKHIEYVKFIEVKDERVLKDIDTWEDYESIVNNK